MGSILGFVQLQWQSTICHGGESVGCGVGRRDPISTFDEINDWLNDHPTHVIVIYLEVNEEVNEAADLAISLTDIDNLVQAVPNEFAKKLYEHEPGDEWPLLGDLVARGKQVLFFYIDGPNGQGEHSPGILYFYGYTMETAYSYASVSELQDRTLENCSII